MILATVPDSCNRLIYPLTSLPARNARFLPPKNEGLACFPLLPSLLLGISPWLPARQTVRLAYGQEYKETCRVLTCGSDGLKKVYAFFSINSINIIRMHMLRSLQYYS